MTETSLPTLPRRPSKDSRKPFGSQNQKLAYPHRANFNRHWFNDSPGRIQQALEAGYTHVENREGAKVSRVVGVNEGGGALTAYLMEIPQEWYDEDMASQQKQVDDMDRAIREGAVAGKVGQDGRYIPSQGIKMTTGSRP